MQSATLVDSDDDEQLATAPPTTEAENQQEDADISKLLLMKKLLSIRNRARSATFSTQRASFGTKNPQIEATDLHTAYRLPLHRLSDTQLQILLQKYAEKDENNKEVIIPNLKVRTTIIQF